MAQNIVSKNIPLIVYDLAGTKERSPDKAIIAESNRDVAQKAKVIALSLPNIESNESVIREIADVATSGTVIVDTCTIGPQAAAENKKILDSAGILYLDSPVSGLKFRAEEGALVSMVAGDAEALILARPLIEGYSRVIYHVGSEAGQGQRMKVLNNAICISSYVTTSEALAYGEAGGLEISSMLEVINESSGQNFATQHLFPKYVATKNFDQSGAEAHIVEKDLGLFINSSTSDQTPNRLLAAAHEIIAEFSSNNPTQDQMMIYPYIRGKK
jgi:3-hydroxyisobutyrate dehydrogenase